MGNPASIIVAKRRVKVTMSLRPTPVPSWMLSSRAFLLTLVGESCWARRRWLTASSDSASILPVRSAPVRARASQTNSAMARSVHPAAARWAARGSGATWRREVAGSPALFDLASVTKAMTAVAVVRAGIDRGTPLGRWLPETRGTPSEDVPLELFLAHRAGLDGHRPLFAPLLEGRSVDRAGALREAAMARRPGAVGPAPTQGFPPLYPPPGYALP